jgi:hypothetical protein
MGLIDFFRLLEIGLNCLLIGDLLLADLKNQSVCSCSALMRNRRMYECNKAVSSVTTM